MAVQKSTALPDRIRTFIGEILVELKKVTWPQKDEIKASTSVVALLLAIMAAITGGMDVVFQFLMLMFFKLG